VVKEIKEHKELVKDGVKDGLKDVVKDHKELAKEVVKELRKETIKDRKEILKDNTPDKQLQKEAIMDFKAAVKEVKELGFENRPDLPGGGGDPFGRLRPGGLAEGDSGSVEDRVAALEIAVFGTTAATGAEAFIDESLRPDLMGSAGGDATQALEQGQPSGDAQAKRDFDAPQA